MFCNFRLVVNFLFIFYLCLDFDFNFSNFETLYSNSR